MFDIQHPQVSRASLETGGWGWGWGWGLGLGVGVGVEGPREGVGFFL